MVTRAEGTSVDHLRVARVMDNVDREALQDHVLLRAAHTTIGLEFAECIITDPVHGAELEEVRVVTGVAGHRGRGERSLQKTGVLGVELCGELEGTCGLHAGATDGTEARSG